MWNSSIWVAVTLLEIRALPLDFVVREEVLDHTDLLEARVDDGAHGGVKGFAVADVVALVLCDEVFEIPRWVVDPADFVDVVDEVAVSSSWLTLMARKVGK